MSSSLIVEEVYDQFALSNEQIKAGTDVIACFRDDVNGIRWSVLIAQMQSGKTETYLFICCELLRLQIIESVVIFSGNAETDLRDQLKRLIEGTNDSFYDKYDGYLDDVVGLPRAERRRLKNNAKEQITLVWGTELGKYTNTHSKTLFIWEEAHHAQTKNQRPDKFLKKIGILANGDRNALSQNNNFVLSVSATPFSGFSDWLGCGNL